MAAFVKLFAIISFIGLMISLKLTHGSQLGTDELLIVVLSQPNSFHMERSHAFKEHLDSQGELDILFVHDFLPSGHAWTLFPIIPSVKKYLEGQQHKWVCICEEETRFDLPRILSILSKYDHEQPKFLGHALFDKETTVIHHYAFHSDPTVFKYPDTAAGVFFSLKLIADLGNRLRNDRVTIDSPVDFSIDPKHELAKYLFDEGKEISLTHSEHLCLKRNEGCATYIASSFPQCEEPLADNQIYVAVKTCQKYHSDRVSVVKKTWAMETNSIEYLSEADDPSVPTVKLPVENTEKGHCAKMMAILQRALTKYTERLWYIVTDDDTILSVRRLRRLLACYNPDEAVVLGERYGYKAAAGYGYDYITGGGGMVFSRVALAILIESQICECPSPDAPDDMTLGMCLKRLGIPLTHSPLFHQARPNDYSDGYLSHQIPISFHKHWNADPIQVYNTWLREETNEHDEL